MGYREDMQHYEPPLIDREADADRQELKIIDLFLKAMDSYPEIENCSSPINDPDDTTKLADNAAWKHLKDVSECYVFMNRLKMESDAYWSAQPLEDGQ